MKRISPFIFLLALLSAFPPLSTDMYLAAIPLLQKEWNESLVVVNLTLISFFVTYCICLLVYGPLSDRYGRRPPLLFGIVLFIVACFFCSISRNAEMMIGARIMQGAGAAAASAIVLAISKDLFSGPERQRVFIQIGVIVAAAPMIAPVIGGWVIQLSSWRWIFLLQAFMGTIALCGVLRMEEPLQNAGQTSFKEVAGSYLRLFRNGRYMLLTITLSIIGIPFFAFIAGSSDIYIAKLGYDERAFGYFFAVNSFAFVVAPLTFSRLARRFKAVQLLPFGFAGMFCSSLLMLLPLFPLPWRIALPMWFFTFSFSFCRPPGNNLILEQVDSDIGAASALMVFLFFMIGVVAMWFFSLGWEDQVFTLGLLGVSAVAAASLLWVILFRFFRPRHE